LAAIDIHSHIVWDVDDGAANPEESWEMLAVAKDSGTTDIVATPHLNSRYAFDPKLTNERIADLAQKTGGRPRIYAGCEVHLTVDTVEQVLRSPSSYTINGTQYLLVEIPNVQVGRHIEVALKRLLDQGLSPIVAHPERNPVLQDKPEMLERWVDLGCFLQLTAMSITGRFGGRTKAASAWILDRGLAHAVASDCHDPERRHPRLDEAYAAVSSRYGAEYAAILFKENPRDILDGVRLPGGPHRCERPSASWWQVWRREA
jgi:protein-tyrosine phosphatase